MNDFMKEAINEAMIGVKRKDGGPFGAVVIRKGLIVGKGHNAVVGTNDPTAHGEVIAIREAGKNLGKFDLSDCELYTTCEPCPMCYSAIHWARIPVVYYGCTKDDAAKLGFDDLLLEKILSKNEALAEIEMIQLDRDDCMEIFMLYDSDEDKQLY